MERTRDEVVRLLHERGDCSVAELSEEIGVSAGSIRRYIDVMVADGLVTSQLHRQSRGRPMARYRLSEAGEEQSSGGYYQRLLTRLSPAIAGLSAAEVDGQDGPGVLDRIFDRVAESVAREHAPSVHGASLGERVYQVTVALSNEGILRGVEDAGDFFRLTNASCPYRTTAEETHACCAADRRAIELLLGAPVEQVTTVAGGGLSCEYLVAKDHIEGQAAGGSLLPVMELKGAPTR
jgi:predicted ArsR family transcriptional regulator